MAMEKSGPNTGSISLAIPLYNFVSIGFQGILA